MFCDLCDTVHIPLPLPLQGLLTLEMSNCGDVAAFASVPKITNLLSSDASIPQEKETISMNCKNSTTCICISALFPPTFLHPITFGWLTGAVQKNCWLLSFLEPAKTSGEPDTRTYVTAEFTYFYHSDNKLITRPFLPVSLSVPLENMSTFSPFIDLNLPS